MPRIAKILAKIGDSLVEKHANAVGKLKEAKQRKRSSRKSIVDELRELSKKLASLGDRFEEDADGRSKGSMKKWLRPTKRTVRNIVGRFLNKLAAKPEMV